MRNNEKHLSELWRGKAYSFFCNHECECFPCHNANEGQDFNCLFCFCPLYIMNDCGGKFKYLNNGVKDCSDCSLPHDREQYGYVTGMIQQSALKKETRDFI